MAGECAWCGRPIERGGRKSGPCVNTDQGMICAECMPAYFASLGSPDKQRPPVLKAVPRPPIPPETHAQANLCDVTPAPETPPAAPPTPTPPSPPPAQPADGNATRILDEMRQDLKDIRQSLMFERASLWNVLGGVAQCFAVASVGVAAVQWGNGATDFLILGLLLQVMALTFFVKNKG